MGERRRGWLELQLRWLSIGLRHWDRNCPRSSVDGDVTHQRLSVRAGISNVDRLSAVLNADGPIIWSVGGSGCA